MSYISPQAIRAITPQQGKGFEIAIRDDLQHAVKSIPYSEFVQDFIAGGDASTTQYSEQQLENAYAVSVYLFSAMRKVANLASSLKLVAEVKKDDGWERVPETHHLNKIFSEFGADGLYKSVMFYMLHGETILYKQKTRKALAQARDKGEMLWRYGQGAIAGIHVIPPYNYELERGMDDIVTGLVINQLRPQDNTEGYEYQRSRFDRHEFVLVQDFSPSRNDSAVSMASLAINDAITDSAISRWMSHYFMSGAMPMLLVMPEDSDVDQSEDELRKQKSFFERTWQGLFGRFSLRAVFSTRKYRVEQVGIDADKVTAPELKSQTLKSIASVFQLTPDLIVPPEGGSNARHEVLVSQAYTNAVLPIVEQMCAQITRDFGFTGQNIRIVVDKEAIEALQAERGERAQTEISILQSGVQSLGETQRRLGVPVDERLEDFYYVNGDFKSVETILKANETILTAIPDHLSNVYMQAWNDNLATRNEVRAVLGLKTPDNVPNGFKADIYPDTGGGGFGGGQGGQPDPTPPANPNPPQLPPKDGADVTGGQPPKEDENSDTPDLSHSGDKGDNEGKRDGKGKPQQGQQSLQPNSTDTPSQPHTGTTGSTPTHAPNNQITEIPENGVYEAHSSTNAPDSVYTAYLDISYDDTLMAVIQSIAPMWRNHDVTYATPDSYRVNVLDISAPDGWGDDYKTLLPDFIPTLVLRGQDIRQDDNDITSVKMFIETEPNLVDLVSKLATGVGAYANARISRHYAPHVVLGSLGDVSTLPLVNTTIALQPTRLVFERADGHVVFEIPVLSDEVATRLNGAPHGDYKNRQMAITALASIDGNRQRIQRGLIYWRTHGVPPRNLPPYVQGQVQATLNNGVDLFDAIAMALDANAIGKFDTDYAKERNIMPRQKDAWDELRAWQRQATRKGMKSAIKSTHRFETVLLPLNVDEFIRDGIRACKSEAEVGQVFDEARTLLDETLDVQTPNEDNFEAWAQRMKELGGDFADLVPDDVPNNTDVVESSVEITDENEDSEDES
jgi:hypothetical protein